MDSYRQRFFALLLPITILTSIISLIYLQNTYGHDLSQTLPMACVFGFLSALVLTFIAAFIFLLPPQNTSRKVNLSHRKSTKEAISNTKPQKEVKEVPLNTLEQEPSVEVSIKTQETLKPTLYTAIMMMDKDLTYTIILQAIELYKIGTLILNEKEKDFIHIQMPLEVIEIYIIKLTNHSSKLTLRTIQHTEEAKEIIKYMKEKESTFF